MKGLYETIFGTCNENTSSVVDSRTQGLANQAFNSAYNQYAQQQSLNSAQQAYSQQLLGQYHMYKKEPANWVYNGRDCTLKEFTELMWPDDEQARLMFILKHGGV